MGVATYAQANLPLPVLHPPAPPPLTVTTTHSPPRHAQHNIHHTNVEAQKQLELVQPESPQVHTIQHLSICLSCGSALYSSVNQYGAKQQVLFKQEIPTE